MLMTMYIPLRRPMPLLLHLSAACKTGVWFSPLTYAYVDKLAAVPVFTWLTLLAHGRDDGYIVGSCLQYGNCRKIHSDRCVNVPG